MEYIDNYIFDEIAVGTSVSAVRRLTAEDMRLLDILSGIGPSTDNAVFPERLAQGMWGGILIFTVLGADYPGTGTRYLRQKLEFCRPLHLDEDVTTTVTVLEKNPQNRQVTLQCQCVSQRGEILVSGTTEVLAPTQKIRRTRTAMPPAQRIDQNARYRRLMGLTQGLNPIRVAVVHPCDAESLRGAVEAANAELIVPTLVGPAAKIAATAASAGLNIAAYTMVDTPHSHAAAAQAVALARGGEVDAIMKGSLHTDELMAAVVSSESGLRTGRRMSHVFAMDVPSYSHPLLITDAAINIAPDLNVKRDIVQNAIDLAHVLGIPEPRVAILAAVETINDKLRSTLDAAALCKMAERGQITGGILDGPLAFDNAVSAAAAEAKQLHSSVAGHADILVVPELESGNMLAKQLQYLANAQAAGIVLGARVPIVLTSRADLSHARIASCAMALLVVRKHA